MTTWTKADIDALVDGATNGQCDCIPALFVPRDLGKDNSVVEARHLKRALYLAAGLTADGQPKPEKIRCWSYRSATGGPWIGVGDPLRYGAVPLTYGWFVPDGAE